MQRRRFFLALAAFPAALKAESGSVRGRLLQDDGQPPRIASGGRTIMLDGDPQTVAVLLDERLRSEDFEALGAFHGPDRFAVRPIHERAMFVWRRGKRLVITYWCEVCAIRTFSPGPCQCCQQPMALHPRDPALKDQDPDP
jgi:hypothetical protein